MRGSGFVEADGCSTNPKPIPNTPMWTTEVISRSLQKKTPRLKIDVEHPQDRPESMPSTSKFRKHRNGGHAENHFGISPDVIDRPRDGPRWSWGGVVPVPPRVRGRRPKAEVLRYLRIRT